MSHQIPPRPAVLNTPYDQHGAPNFAELSALGWQPSEVLDFSVNSNPFGTFPALQHAIADIDISRYPDRDCLALRDALAQHRSTDGQVIEPEQLIITNGTAELIALIAAVYLTSADTVLVCGPTFGEYARACRLQGATVNMLTADRATNFGFDLNDMHNALVATRTKICFICNPNNPTGQVIPHGALLKLAQAHPHTLFVIDEAYANFVPKLDRFTRVDCRNILAMCSMTKDVAIAGIRLGYGLGHSEIIQALSLARTPWSVNSIAQTLGVMALQHWKPIAAQLETLQAYKTTLMTALRQQGWEVVSSNTNYFLVNVSDASACRSFLMARKLQVRDCASFGLPSYIRVATRLPQDNQKLIAALAEYKRTLS